MDRPTLNPSLFDDSDRSPATHADEPWQVGGLLRQLLTPIGQLIGLLYRLLQTPLWQRRNPREVDDRSKLLRWVSPVIFRMMFLGVLLIAVVMANVYLIAHPFSPVALGPPVSGAVHVERVRLNTSDGVTIETYLSPAMDENQLLAHGEVAVRAIWPAVVLIPDQRGDGRGMDPMIRTLHDAGYVAMLVRLRGTSSFDSPQTFGINEKRDVEAAVAYLRTLHYVDPTRITLIGTGTGATAAMLARAGDSSLAHVIVYEPVTSFDEVLAEHVSSAWLRPACRWAFEMLYQVDVEDLDCDSLLRTQNQKVLVLTGHPARQPQRQLIASYLQADAEQMSAAR